MPDKLATLVFDNTTGYFDLSKREDQPTPTEEGNTTGDWGLQWNKVMGRYAQKMNLLDEIAERHGINIVVISHPVAQYITVGMGKSKERVLTRWHVDVPGGGDNDVLVPFDEVYHLMTVPGADGIAPQRRLLCETHLLNGVPFQAKTRKGVKGPIINPTYEKIIAALPKDTQKPTKFVIVGDPGNGKTTLANTFPGPRLFIDMRGGCDEMAKKPDTKIVKPKTVSEVYRVLLKVRSKPEW